MYSLFENLLAPLENYSLLESSIPSFFLTGLAARDDNAWVQLIIIAVIIGFSVLKAIVRSIKAAAEQKSGQSKYNPTPTKPKKRYVAADDSYKTLEQLREERIAQIRAALGIPGPPTEPQPVAAEVPQVVEKVEKPARPPKPESPSAYTAPPPLEFYAEATPSKVSAGEIGSKPTKVSPHKQTVSATVHQLLFSAPQDLRNAILYQEILGKPVALRDAV